MMQTPPHVGSIQATLRGGSARPCGEHHAAATTVAAGRTVLPVHQLGAGG